MGVPLDSSPQLLTGAAVTSVQTGLFVLNQPVEGWYSGGPVLDRDGVLLRMAVRATEKQTYCLPLIAIGTAIIACGKTVETSSDPFLRTDAAAAPTGK